MIEVKPDPLQVISVLRKDAVEDEPHFLPVFREHRGAGVSAVGADEGIVVFLADVLVKIVQRIGEVHPFADAVKQRAGMLGRVLFEAGVGQVCDHQPEGVRRAIDAAALLLFERRERRHMAADDLCKGGVQGARALVSLFEEGTHEPPLALVLDVVGELVIGEQRVQAGDGAGDFVVGGDGPLDDGVQDAVPLLDLYVTVHYVVQQGGQKCHVVGERRAGALAAAPADALAQAAVQRLVQDAVLYVHMGNIRLDVAEHFLFSLVKPDLAINFGERSARDAEGALRARLDDARKVCLIREQARLFCLHGRERIGDRFADGELEVPVSLAGEFALRLLRPLAGKGAVDGE